MLHFEQSPSSEGCFQVKTSFILLPFIIIFFSGSSSSFSESNSCFRWGGFEAERACSYIFIRFFFSIWRNEFKCKTQLVELVVSISPFQVQNILHGDEFLNWRQCGKKTGIPTFLHLAHKRCLSEFRCFFFNRMYIWCHSHVHERFTTFLNLEHFSILKVKLLWWAATPNLQLKLYMTLLSPAVILPIQALIHLTGTIS